MRTALTDCYGQLENLCGCLTYIGRWRRRSSNDRRVREDDRAEGMQKLDTKTARYDKRSGALGLSKRVIELKKQSTFLRLLG